MNTYTNQIIQQVLPICIQPKQDIQILKEDDNISDNFKPHENKKTVLEKQDIEKDDIDYVDQSLNTGNYTKDLLLRHIL